MSITEKSIICRNLGEYSLLNEFRVSEKFHDVILIVEDRSFPCHRCILAASMKYFCTMFLGEYAEAEKKEIKLKYINADDFELLLTYVYGGSVTVDAENVYRLLKIAHFLGSASLEDACANYIIQNESLFTFEYVLSIFMFASGSNITILLGGLKKWMAANFVHLSKCKELLRLSGDDLMRILYHQDFEKNTVALLDFLMVWVKFHPREGKKLLPKILDELTDCKEEQIKDWLMKLFLDIDVSINTPEDNDEKKNGACSHEVEDSYPSCSFGLNESEFFFEEEDEIPVPPFKLITHDIHKNEEGKTCKTVGNYRFRADNDVYLVDSKFGDLLYERCAENFDYKSVKVNGIEFSIFSFYFSTYRTASSRYVFDYFHNYDIFFGKTKLNSLTGTIFDENHENRIPAFITSNSRDRNILTVATLGMNVYLYSNTDLIVYNCDRNIPWVYEKEFSKLHAPNLVSSANSLYMIGGKSFNCKSSSEEDARSFQTIDTREGKFSQLPTMKYARCKAASCICDDKVYVSGGCDMTYFMNAPMEYYDIRAGKWSEFETQMPKAKMNHTLVAYDDHLWFFGGEKFGDSLRKYDSTWYSYNLRENTWSDIFPLPNSYGQYRIERILDVKVDL